jgi:hypothetical protein
VAVDFPDEFFVFIYAPFKVQFLVHLLKLDIIIGFEADEEIPAFRFCCCFNTRGSSATFIETCPIQSLRMPARPFAEEFDGSFVTLLAVANQVIIHEQEKAFVDGSDLFETSSTGRILNCRPLKDVYRTELQSKGHPRRLDRTEQVSGMEKIVTGHRLPDHLIPGRMVQRLQPVILKVTDHLLPEAFSFGRSQPNLHISMLRPAS